LPFLKFVHKIGCYRRNKWLLNNALLAESGRRGLHETFIMFNVSFIGTCVKRDSTSKFTSRSVRRSQIFRIFCMKSVELVMCDSNFPVRECSVCARKRINCMSESVWH